VFEDIKEGKLTTSENGGEMDLGLDQILNFKRDPGDRNRTSPFAFTGNRFEFRAVGSAQSVSGPLVAMNTMLADSLNWIADQLETQLKDNDNTAAVINVLQELINKHGNAVFGGDGYSSDWHEAAVKERGLKNIPTTADALPALQEDSVKTLFETTGVLSPAELESRYEVYSEQYILSIEVEAKLVIDIAKTMIYPAATRYLSDLSMANAGLNEMGIEMDNTVAKTVAAEAAAMMANVTKLSDALEKEDFASTDDHTQYFANEIHELMNEVRSHADALEAEVADELWPLAKYHEMLFIK